MAVKSKKREREEVIIDLSKASAIKRGEVAIPEFDEFCKSVSTEDCRTMLMAGSIKTKTFTSYASRIRYALKLLNALSEECITKLGAKRVDKIFLEPTYAYQMMSKAAEAISKEAFTTILAYKSDKGLGGNMILRCALLKAQQMMGGILWANEPLYRDMAIVADLRARHLNPNPLRPPGAITEEMLEQLIQWMENDTQQIPHKHLLAKFWRSEFYGCFRISELQKLKVSHVIKEEGVWLEDPKHKRRISTGPTNLKKQLSKWAGGLIAQEIIEDMCGTKREEDFVFGTLWPLETLNKIIKRGSIALGWREDLRYGTHGFRHGGIYYLVESEEIEVPSEEIKKALDMNEDMILYYARSNDDRVGENRGEKVRHSAAELYLHIADKETLYNPLRSSILTTSKADRQTRIGRKSNEPPLTATAKKAALMLKKPEAYVDYVSLLTQDQGRDFLRSKLNIKEYVQMLQQTNNIGLKL